MPPHSSPFVAMLKEFSKIEAEKFGFFALRGPPKQKSHKATDSVRTPIPQLLGVLFFISQDDEKKTPNQY